MAGNALTPGGSPAELDWPGDARRDRLIGDWYIYQRTGGHRTSTDDLITAWYACHRYPEPPARYLDLGCGIGSVLLMVCHKLRPGIAVGLEAQAQSATMARRAIAELPPQDASIDVKLADFREFNFGGETYDLVTGSPPYFPLHAGVLPADAQRRACRFEERGGVEAYISTAARAMTQGGRFYIVFQTRSSDRVEAAAAAAALHITGRADFQMRSDRVEPFLSVYEMSRVATDAPQRFACAVRDGDGEITADYQRLRLQLGVSR